MVWGDGAFSGALAFLPLLFCFCGCFLLFSQSLSMSSKSMFYFCLLGCVFICPFYFISMQSSFNIQPLRLSSSSTRYQSPPVRSMRILMPGVRLTRLPDWYSGIVRNWLPSVSAVCSESFMVVVVAKNRSMMAVAKLNRGRGVFLMVSVFVFCFLYRIKLVISSRKLKMAFIIAHVADGSSVLWRFAVFSRATRSFFAIKGKSELRSVVRNSASCVT